MQYRQLGRSKIEISAILFGGWQSGKSGWTALTTRYHCGPPRRV